MRDILVELGTGGRIMRRGSTDGGFGVEDLMKRRSYGTGYLFVKRDRNGREIWYGQWRAGATNVKRKIGAKRERGSRDGLTRVQAERELLGALRRMRSSARQATGERSPKRARSTSITSST